MSEKDTIPAKTVACVLTAVALLAPLAVHVSVDLLEGDARSSAFSVVWSLVFNSMTNPSIYPMIAFNYGYAILRMAFVWQMYRHYRGIVSRRTVLLTGIIAELQMVFFAITAFSYDWIIPSFERSILIPVPTLLLAGILFLRMLPPVESSRDPWDTHPETIEKIHS